MSSSGGKRKPTRLSHFIATHDQWMGGFHRTNFVLADGVVFRALGDGFIAAEGLIECDRGIAIDVEKNLELLDDAEDPLVRTRSYTYCAKLSGVGLIRRWCSPHSPPGGAHHPYHHKHVFDPFQAEAEYQVDFVRFEPDLQPTLGEAIQEVFEWHCEHLERLSEDRVVTARASRPVVDK